MVLNTFDLNVHSHVDSHFTHNPQIISTIADLTQSDRLQPGRGRKSPPRQRLHTVETVSRTKAVLHMHKQATDYVIHHTHSTYCLSCPT
jgi:hypothetical protein